MLVCIDKMTCALMYKRIIPRWQEKIVQTKALIRDHEHDLPDIEDEPERERVEKELAWMKGQADWMEETIIQIIISEGQNEVADFKKGGFDIIPHRDRMKKGFEVGDNRVDVEAAFKDPGHPFRVAVVCAMWLTGFDVESLSTLYIDKPMKAHTLMQAIARANRVYPGKDFGLIVDYNGMLKSLRQALADYALGDDGADGGEAIVAPIEERVQALEAALEETEHHLRGLGFEPTQLIGAEGFKRIQGIADGVDVAYTSDEAKRRFEILARQVFIRFKALIMEPSAAAYGERHDNLEAIYKKLGERRDTADVSELLDELREIVNEAIRAQPEEAVKEARFYNLSGIDLEKLRDEFSKRVRRKASVLGDIREIVEKKLAQMLKRNPQRMDYYKRYSEIIADYNREKDRVSLEETFAKLVDLMKGLDAEQRRAAEEGLSEDELAIFDLLKKENLTKAERERLKQASQSLLDSIQALIAPLERWTEKEKTQAEVEILILDRVFEVLPDPPFTEEEKQAVATRIYQHVWQQSAGGRFAVATVA